MRAFSITYEDGTVIAPILGNGPSDVIAENEDSRAIVKVKRLADVVIEVSGGVAEVVAGHATIIDHDERTVETLGRGGLTMIDYAELESELIKIAPAAERWTEIVNAGEENERMNEYPGMEVIGRYGELCQLLDEAGRPSVI